MPPQRGLLSKPFSAGALGWVLEKAKRMSRERVIKCQCDRCPRYWFEPVTASTSPESPPTNAAEVRFVDSENEEVLAQAYETLCPSCNKAVRNYMRSILKRPKDEEEFEAKEEKRKAPPLPHELPTGRSRDEVS